MDVSVVGGGVVGLTCALELARAGHRVRVHTADPVAATTSAVAAAIWFPYRAAPADEVLRWGQISLDVLRYLAEDRGTGVRMMPGTVVSRTPEPDLSWTPAVPDARPATPDELPPGVSGGTRCTLPVAHMGRYLPWLLAACDDADVKVVGGRVTSLSEVPGDVVVVAAGLASGALLGDDTCYAVQGQVVRLADPGLTGRLAARRGEPGGAHLRHPPRHGRRLRRDGGRPGDRHRAGPGRRGGGAAPGAGAGARARRRAGAVPRGRPATRPAHRAAGEPRARRPRGGHLLRARRRRRDPVVGLRRRRRAPGRRGFVGVTPPIPLHPQGARASRAIAA
jgi:glycine/D-amino acid oxidase-like deaminating enzyme